MVNGGPASLGEIEGLMADSMTAIQETHKAVMNMQTILLVLPDINTMIKAMVTTQQMMASAAKSMAETFEKSEQRQNMLETRTGTLYEHKGVSNTIFGMVVGTLLFVIACLIVWVTGLNVRGSYTDFEIGKTQNQVEQNKTTQNKVNQDVQDKIENLEKK